MSGKITSPNSSMPVSCVIDVRRKAESCAGTVTLEYHGTDCELAMSAFVQAFMSALGFAPVAETSDQSYSSGQRMDDVRKEYLLKRLTEAASVETFINWLDTHYIVKGRPHAR